MTDTRLIPGEPYWMAADTPTTMPSAAEVARRREGLQLAAQLRRYWPELGPVIRELLAASPESR